MYPMPQDALVGATIADRFRIERQLGEGQMSRVYVAEQLAFGRQVALKLLRHELASDPEALARFRREAMAVTRLQSPHTIEFYDFGATATGELYIAMELLGGETLRARLEREHHLAPTEVAAIVAQIAASLGEAHAAGIVHRDLKPENIQFSDQPTPLHPFIKVLDFGLARLEQGDDVRITGQHRTVGTPAYLAPESAAKGGVADARADLYALGVIAFEMLVGERPFARDTPMAMMIAHLRAPIPSAYDRGVELPRGVDAFMQAALAKDPDERIADAATFAAALSAVLVD
jgi:serine/threonine-protein kinase